ncbi:MAG: DsrE family protein [Burkholderiaceae bacterium]|jgi:predicted peroxiredoxin|nr:DsrE family protein [Burkholderiaceae bacterium]
MSEARRLVIVVWSCGPDRPGGAVLAAAPFVYALAARALDQEVEMHFTSSAVRWLVAGEADAAYTDRARSKTVRDFIREAHAAGVKLYACAMARHEHARDETLVDEIEGIAGAATVVDAGAEPDARVMIF